VSNPFTISGIHHVTLVVGDLEAARAFYGKILGLPVLDRPNYEFEGAWFRCGPIELHLLLAEEHQDPSRQHFAVEVDKFDECIASIRCAGVGIVGGPGVRPHNRRSFAFCKDPSGNLIELSGPPG
jgi:glyoxylase I family protein